MSAGEKMVNDSWASKRMNEPESRWLIQQPRLNESGGCGRGRVREGPIAAKKKVVTRTCALVCDYDARALP
jgi:hypothetical protein